MEFQEQHKSQIIYIEAPDKNTRSLSNCRLRPTDSSKELSTIQKDFEEFISKLITPELQNEVAYGLADLLVSLEAKGDITFEQSVEDGEIIFVRRNDQGVNLISIDSEGDLMISVSPYKGDGTRVFTNYAEIDYESVVYTLLS
jgi:hypothetical protein